MLPALSLLLMFWFSYQAIRPVWGQPADPVYWLTVVPSLVSLGSWACALAGGIQMWVVSANIALLLSTAVAITRLVDDYVPAAAWHLLQSWLWVMLAEGAKRLRQRSAHMTPEE